MANSAFAHEAAIIMPSSSTNTGIVTWSGTGANTFLDSTVLVSGNNITIPGTITLGGAAITSTAAEINKLDGASANVTAANLTALTGGGATALHSHSGGGGAVSAVANGADNRVATFSSSDALNGEANLTFDGTHLSVAAQSKIFFDGGSNTYIQELTANNMAFYADGAKQLTIAAGLIMNSDISAQNITFQGTTGFTSDTRVKSTNKLHFGDGTDTYLYQKADDQFALYVGNRHMMQSRAGGFFIGWDTGTNTGSWENAALPNAPSNPHLNGLHIHGGSGDRMHLALSSSDTIVSGSGHGMTAEAANGIFASLEKVNPTCGGLMLNGWLRTGEKVAVQIRGMVTDEQTSQNATATCPILVNAYKASGTGVQSISTSGALFGVSNANNNVKFMSHGNGNIYTDGVLSHNAWDEYNDAELVRALDHLNPTMKGYVENKWDEYITYNEETLVEMGILGDTVANRGLLNVTGLQRLHNGAIWQLYSSLKDQEEEIKSLKEQLVALTEGK